MQQTYGNLYSALGTSRNQMSHSNPDFRKNVVVLLQAFITDVESTFAYLQQNEVPVMVMATEPCVLVESGDSEMIEYP
jgi:hypothetical protein